MSCKKHSRPAAVSPEEAPIKLRISAQKIDQGNLCVVIDRAGLIKHSACSLEERLEGIVHIFAENIGRGRAVIGGVRIVATHWL